MWSLQLNEEDGFYLTFDKNRRPDSQFRGKWEFVCQATNEQAKHYIRVNREAGYLVTRDDEGGIRMLILEE